MRNRLTIGLLMMVVGLSLKAQTTVKEAVAPLLTTVWGQDAPYNLHCPEKTNAQGEPQHCRVGCVACAMAQVMRYHRYPEVGIGTGTNMFNTSLTADFGSTHYDWSHMKNSYRAAYSDEEAEAVATLMFHCGVAVNMIYGLESSSTFTAFANNMTTALVRYFGYESEGLRSVSRSQYTKDEWLAMIREELSNGRPIIYSGNSPSMGGHTWVVDGYDAQGRIHMNWGWLGSANDYYDVDLNLPGLDFCQKQSMVIGIRPPVSNGTGMAEIRWHEGAETNVSIEAGACYDLQGRRVGQPLRPGLYLIDGKKILIR